jgi:hypothetical protein
MPGLSKSVIVTLGVLIWVGLLWVMNQTKSRFGWVDGRGRDEEGEKGRAGRGEEF